MECLGPQCAAMLLDWLKSRIADAAPSPGSAANPQPSQGILWTTAPYQDEAPAIRDPAELAGALEHLEYAVFRRFHNQLTRAERARLDNTIDNALFKVERYAARLAGAEREQAEREGDAIRTAVRQGRERTERLRHQ